MSYIVPIYIDYLERPDVYEQVYNKVVKLAEDRYSQNQQKKALKAAQKRTAAKTAAKAKLKTTPVPVDKQAVELAKRRKALNTAAKKLKVGAPPKPKGDISKVSKQIDPATQRKMNDLKALQKKKDAVNPTLQKGKQKLTAKKVLAKQGAKMSHAQKVHAGKTAAKGSEFGQQTAQTIKTTLKKTSQKKSPGILKTVGKYAPKAGKYAAGAAAAYGGYKLYKRHFSKAAQKCKGKSGAERTLCLQQASGRG